MPDLVANSAEYINKSDITSIPFHEKANWSAKAIKDILLLLLLVGVLLCRCDYCHVILY